MLGVHFRVIAGWLIELGQAAALATNALRMAIANRSPRLAVAL